MDRPAHDLKDVESVETEHHIIAVDCIKQNHFAEVRAVDRIIAFIAVNRNILRRVGDVIFTAGAGDFFAVIVIFDPVDCIDCQDIARLFELKLARALQCRLGRRAGFGDRNNDIIAGFFVSQSAARRFERVAFAEIGNDVVSVSICKQIQLAVSIAAGDGIIAFTAVDRHKFARIDDIIRIRRAVDLRLVVAVFDHIERNIDVQIPAVLNEGLIARALQSNGRRLLRLRD